MRLIHVSPSLSFASSGWLIITVFLVSFYYSSIVHQYSFLSRHESSIVCMMVAAEPPPNDVCTNALPITIGSSPDSVTTMNVTGATFDVPVVLSGPCSLVLYPEVWVTFIGTGSRIVVRASCSDVFIVTVYSGTCDALSCVREDFRQPCLRERWFFDTILGTTYHGRVQVAKYEGNVDLAIFAAPPVGNDICANALPIEIGSEPVAVNTTYATSEYSDNIDCGNTFEETNFPGVWFTVTGTGERLVAKFDDTSCVAGKVTIFIFDGGCPSLSCIAATSGVCTIEALNFVTTLGTQYRIFISTEYEVDGEVSIITAPPVGNDVCIDAIPIPIGLSPIIVNNTLSTIDLDLPTDCVNGNPPQFPGVWFTFTGTGGRFVARSCSDVTTYIAIFSGGCNPSAIQCVNGSHFPCEQERFIFETTMGTQYHILVQTTLEIDTELSLFVAPPIGNDICVNALPIVIGSDPVIINTTYATTDVDAMELCSIGGNYYVPGIWFTFTGTGERLVARSSLCSYNDVRISVFTGGCSPSTLQCVGGTNGLCNRERFMFSTTAGIQYHVLVQTIKDYIDLSLFLAPPIANDICANALPIVIGSSPTIINATYATTDSDVLDDCIGSTYVTQFDPGVWLTFTGTGGRLVARPSYCGTGNYVIDDVRISVFTGGCSPTTLQCVGGTNDPCGQERLIFDTTAGTQYHVLVQIVEENNFDLSIFVAPPVDNDVCTNATPILIGSSPVALNLTYATTDLDILDNCINNVPPSNPGVWFTFTGTGGRLVVSSSCRLTYRYAVTISIYEGGCNISTLRCVSGTTQTCYQPLIFESTAGTQYHALFESDEDVEHDVFVFDAPPAGNDVCTNAIPISIGAASVPLNLTYATVDVDVDDCSGRSPEYPGVWLTFTGNGGLLVARACPLLLEDNNGLYGSSISIFTGGCSPSARQCVVASFQPCEEEQFTFETTTATEYHVLYQSKIDSSIIDFSIYSDTPNATTKPSSKATQKPEAPTKVPTKEPSLSVPTKTSTMAPVLFVPIAQAPANVPIKKVPNPPAVVPVIAPRTNNPTAGLTTAPSTKAPIVLIPVTKAPIKSTTMPLSSTLTKQPNASTKVPVDSPVKTVPIVSPMNLTTSPYSVPTSKVPTRAPSKAPIILTTNPTKSNAPVGVPAKTPAVAVPTGSTINPTMVPTKQLTTSVPKSVTKIPTNAPGLLIPSSTKTPSKALTKAPAKLSNAPARGPISKTPVTVAPRTINPIQAPRVVNPIRAPRSITPTPINSMINMRMMMGMRALTFP